MIPFSGIGNVTAIIAFTTYGLLPMVRNTYTGITNINKDILEAAKGMGSTEFQILYKIKLPIAMLVIFLGFRSMVVMTIALAGIALVVILLLVGSVFMGNTKNNTIKIATKPMTEQFIISEMLSVLIEKNTDLNVEITKGIGGGTSNIQLALIKGDFDLYIEYKGTDWSFVLKEKTIPDADTLYRKLVENYKKDFNLKWVGLYGFNNTYDLAVRKHILILQEYLHNSIKVWNMIRSFLEITTVEQL